MVSQPKEYDFLVVSYAMVGKLLEPLQRAKHQFVTLDESHYIKDQKVQRSIL
jgi:hypothetical protein